MGVSVVFTAISSFGTVIAGVALWLTYTQFRRLDESVKGNSYQLLADQAIQMLKLLMEYPHLKYLDLTDAKASKADRQQAIFDRLLANYLSNMWGQMGFGMLDAVLSETTIISVRGRQRCMIGRAAARPNLRSGHRHAWRPGRQVHQPSRACQSASAWDRHLDAVRGLYNSLWVPGQFLSGAE